MGLATLNNTGMRSNKTQSAMKGANPENFSVFINGRAMREPKRMLYIHSVAKREFGPLHHLLFPKLRLAGCLKGERWVTCAVIPDPIPQVSPDQERGGSRIDEEDGWRAMIDLLNPNNPTDDPYWKNPGAVPAFFTTSNNCDYIAQGVFPSVNQTPTEEELRRAEKARDDRYRAITQKAFTLAAKSTKELNEYLEGNPDVHQAMDALKLKASWHSSHEVKMECPNCGDSISDSLAFHMSTAGVLCILDHERAYKAGAIDKTRYEELAEIKRGPGRPRNS